MTEQEYNVKLRKAKQKARQKEMREEIKNAKHGVKKKFETSKVFIFCLMLLCLEIVIYCEWVMAHTNDLSALYVLIGIPAALAPSLIAYYSKAKAENLMKIGGTGEFPDEEIDHGDMDVEEVDL